MISLFIDTCTAVFLFCLKWYVNRLHQFSYKMYFSFQNDPRNLPLSCKMDLDFWDCLGMENTILSLNGSSIYICDDMK